MSYLRTSHQVAVLTLIPPGHQPAEIPAHLRQAYVEVRTRSIFRNLLTRPLQPLQVSLHREPALARVMARELEQFAPQVVVLMLSRLGWLLPQLAEIPTVVDFVDSLALNMRQRARFDPFLAPLWRWESARMASWERWVAGCATVGTVVAERDRQAVMGGREDLAPKLQVVPFGIPVPDTFSPSRPPQPTLLTTGNLGYFPTVQGIGWFARQVWPRLRRRFPALRWIVAGSRPSRRIRRLVRWGVELIPEPESFAPLWRQASVAVAPIFAGSGTPIKVLEAMAAGVPVVTTPAAAQGLDGIPSQALAQAANAEQWVELIAALLEHPRQAEEQAAVAFAWVRSKHHLPRVGSAFQEVLGAAAMHHR
ncbi:MAG: glycosyltransferase family 4 protein [Thermoanaerobaculum sp.]|nr:glycosyltransferase family 4 protein [Thermoanaerobaculum sp.]